MSYYVGPFNTLYKYHTAGCKKIEYKRKFCYDQCLDCKKKKKVPFPIILPENRGGSIQYNQHNSGSRTSSLSHNH